jgi:hypothetical protein
MVAGGPDGECGTLMIAGRPGWERGRGFRVAGSPGGERGRGFRVAGGPGRERGSGFLIGGNPLRELGSAFLVAGSAFLVAGSVAGDYEAVFLVAGRLLVVVMRLTGKERTVCGSVRGLDGDRAVLMITSGPDIEGRAVLVIARGRVRRRRVGLVVNAHISA